MKHMKLNVLIILLLTFFQNFVFASEIQYSIDNKCRATIKNVLTERLKKVHLQTWDARNFETYLEHFVEYNQMINSKEKLVEDDEVGYREMLVHTRATIAATATSIVSELESNDYDIISTQEIESLWNDCQLDILDEVSYAYATAK